MTAGLWAHIRDIIETGGAAVLVTVVDVAGSAPREPGARLVVRPGGSHGTIGGGELEWQALAEARGYLDGRDGPASGRRRFALGPDLGQCCGGRVDLQFERFDLSDRDLVRRLAGREALGPFRTAAHYVAGQRLCREIVDADADTAPVRAEDENLVETFGRPKTPLLLFGAGHVGRAMVLALAQLPFSVTWIDTRASAFPGAVPANVLCRLVENPVELLEQAPAGAFVLVMTYSHALDQAITHAALASRRFGYVGLIGSATKRTRFERRIRAAGIDEATLDELRCPIGIAGISSREPAVIAAATAAELLQRQEYLTTTHELSASRAEPAAPEPLAVLSQ